MYHEKMAVAIKTNNHVLREFKDITYLPFGAEYSIFLKNLHTRRAVAKIEIDGKNVTGNGLVINANSSIDLERFISDNLDKGNRFKFIERTKNIEKHRGVGVEDGLVRIEFEFERENTLNYQNYIKGLQPTPQWPTGPVWTPPPLWSEKYGDFTTTLTNTYCATSADAKLTRSITTNAVCQTNDVGITVAGSISDQKFTSTFVQTDGIKHVMVLKLLGETEIGKKIEQPVTVKSKPKCTSCGRQNKATSKFCTECGTSLELV